MGVQLALMAASYCRHTEGVTILLEKGGVNVISCNEDGLTVLALALQNREGHRPFLLRSGTGDTRCGENLFFSARRKAQMLMYLGRSGPLPRQQDDRGRLLQLDSHRSRYASISPLCASLGVRP